MVTSMAAVGGIDSNQPKGAGEELMAAATATVAQTTMAMVTALITMLMPMPTTLH
jgi:hypothetical protein